MNSITRSLLAVVSAMLTFTYVPAADSAVKSAGTPMAMGNEMPAPEMDMSPGLNVGDTAPTFTLRDAAGNEASLDALLARGKVALVFYRSADWCPYCIAQLKELQANLSAFEQAGVTLVGISYDAVDVLARAAKKHGVTFPLLSDAGSKTIDAFGIRNAEARGKAMGVPHPAIFVLDETGVIRAKLMHEGYKTRPTPAEIIAAAKSAEMMK